MSAHLSAETFQDLQQALKEDPNSGIIHAMLANMYGNAYALDYPNSEGSIEKMVELVEKAMRLDPESQVVRIIYVFTCFIRDQKERFFQEVDHCLNMNLYSPMRLGTIGFHLSLFGEWERGKELLDKAMNKNIGYPLYFHGVTSLYFYRLGKCQEAYNEALKYDIPGLFWGPMLRIACLGKLNRKNDATSEIEQLMALKPDFVKKSNFLISRFIKEEELVKTVTDGLKKAGLKV